jgi:hypothetical protein
MSAGIYLFNYFNLPADWKARVLSTMVGRLPSPFLY